ncbi:inorganic diphosphatase [Conexibacter sp. CPCC 206217]|uniref:inorganic diphosphatase n=1 Tax=Conexibacter sp. CPCC 206217 TaxID=3064574 RepID=UPI0027238358|nr:inorganic diphosphatase [Conexibacter sp. CPCC 206217]MDO8209546.1 inorganic diphosphatase [Conexibacter sp. CPCC 206217]
MSARPVVIEQLRFGVSDLARSRAFYARALAPLGLAELEPAAADVEVEEIVFGLAGTVAFRLAVHAAPAASLQVGFAARGRAEVDAFHAAALRAGGSDHAAPQLRDERGSATYGATVVDPDGHRVEVVARGAAVHADALAADPRLIAVIEIPKGTRNKYEYDPVLGGFTFDRLLMTAAAYPADDGYFPNTLGEDGDPLDVLVCLSEPTFPGCLIPVKPVGLFKMRDDQGIDDKVICVPLHDTNWGGYDHLDELPELLRNEIAQFFAIYKDLEGKTVEVGGWRSREDALASIEAAHERFDRRREETGLSFDGPGGGLPA